MPHWSHPPGIVDHRWEPETEWHRKWKDFFPKECQEVCHRPENGERHLADVKTAHGQVLEFQHSAIPEEERSSLEAIYGLMCWVVDGLRLKNDRAKFFETLRLGLVVQENSLTIVVPTCCASGRTARSSLCLTSERSKSLPTRYPLEPRSCGLRVRTGERRDRADADPSSAVPRRYAQERAAHRRQRRRDSRTGSGAGLEETPPKLAHVNWRVRLRRQRLSVKLRTQCRTRQM